MESDLLELLRYDRTNPSRDALLPRREGSR
jgi:hypothetical protein